MFPPCDSNQTGHITLKELKLSMEDCYSQGLKGCVLREMLSIHKNPMVPDHASQMTFFCGHSTECDMFNGEALFQKAVEVIKTLPYRWQE